MTPDEKAGHLANCFYQLFKVDLENSISLREANACAMICVDKIVMELEKNGDDYWSPKYWEEVKETLQKINSNDSLFNDLL